MNTNPDFTPRDKPFLPRGAGTSVPFMCGRCHKPRLQLGRKLQRVLGVRCFVCAGCYRMPKAAA